MVAILNIELDTDGRGKERVVLAIIRTTIVLYRTRRWTEPDQVTLTGTTFTIMVPSSVPNDYCGCQLYYHFRSDT